MRDVLLPDVDIAIPRFNNGCTRFAYVKLHVPPLEERLHQIAQSNKLTGTMVPFRQWPSDLSALGAFVRHILTEASSLQFGLSWSV